MLYKVSILVIHCVGILIRMKLNLFIGDLSTTQH